MLLKALQKLDAEVLDFQGDKLSELIYLPVAETLKSFCRQDEEFAQAVAQSEKTLSDCCKQILKGVRNSISDIDTYRKAVAFYFPNADIETKMTIKLNPYENEAESGTDLFSLSLDDLFD